MPQMKRRALLYLPGSSQRMMEKAERRGADVLVLDLEDGVHPDAKSEARDRIANALSRLDWGVSEVFVRVNGSDTPWSRDDMEMVRNARPAGVVLPKSEDPKLVREVAARLDPMPLFLMVETASGVLVAAELARVKGVAGLVFGAADYRESLRAGRLPDEGELLYARACILNSARAAGVDAFDTPWFEYKDPEGLRASALRVRGMGFDGKTAIHPNQVSVIQDVFSPSSAEVERARAIVEVMEKALADGHNVAVLGGEMVEALHMKQARRILARAGS